MKTPAEISQELTSKRQQESLTRSNLAARQQATESITKAIGNIKLEAPEKTSVEWQVSLKGLRELLIGLDVTIKSVTQLVDSLPTVVDEIKNNNGVNLKELKSLADSIKSIRIPEVKVPEFPKPVDKVEIKNLKRTEQLLEVIANKQTPVPIVNIPEQSNKMEITNFPAEEPDKELLGFFWRKDSNGNLEEFTEIYENEKVVSKGWNLGSVTITRYDK